MTAFPLPVPFDDFEWDNLIHFLKTCPGRLAAAVVPGEAAQTALIARLPPAIDPMPVAVAPLDANPSALARLALDTGERDAVLIIPFIARPDFRDDKDAQNFLESLNYQRERLAAKQVRTLFILTERQDTFMLRFADDLRDWVHPFRFPGAVPVSTREMRPENLDSIPPPPSGTNKATIDIMKDQLRRARESGMSGTQVLRDYAAPLFRALVKDGRNEEAWHMWHYDLNEGESLSLLDPKDRFLLLQGRINLAEATQDLQEMDRWSQRYLDETRGSVEPLDEARAFFSRGRYLRRTNDFRNAMAIFEKALVLFKAAGERNSIANCLNNLGQMQHLMDDNEAALKSHRQAIAIFKEVGNRLGEAESLLFIGNVQQVFKEYETALQSYIEALGIFSFLGDIYRQASALNSIGDIHRLRNENEAAISFYSRALAKFKQIGDRQGEAITLASMGAAHTFSNEFEAAMQSYEQAFALCKEIGYPLGEANTLAGQSRVRLLQGDKVNSDLLLEKALSTYLTIGSKFNIPAQIGNHGWALLNIGDADRARPYFLKAAELFDEMGLHDYAERHRKAAEGD